MNNIEVRRSGSGGWKVYDMSNKRYALSARRFAKKEKIFTKYFSATG